MRLVILLGFIAAFTACAGDKPAEETIAADEANPTLPDAPGSAGEAAAKPAGQGSADAPDAKTEAAKAPVAAEGQLYVATWVLNVRGGAGMTHPVVRTIPKGTVVNVLERKAIWIKIGENEWVSDKHLSKDPVK